MNKIGYISFFLTVLSLVIFSQYDLNEFLQELIPYVPSDKLENFGAWVAVTLSHDIIQPLKTTGLIPFENCFDQETKDEKRIMVAVSKGGSVFTASLAWEIFRTCGLKVGLGYTDNELWPPVPETPPTRPLDLYLAVANPKRWPEVLGQDTRYKCVVFTRDPFERMISLYKYSRDGGESGLLPHAKVMKKMNSTAERLDYVWVFFGRASLEITHQVLVESLERPACKQVKVDSFFAGDGFIESSSLVLDGLAIRKNLYPSLIGRFLKHNISGKEHSHVSGKNVGREEQFELRQLLRTRKDIFDTLYQQQKELGYSTL